MGGKAWGSTGGHGACKCRAERLLPFFLHRILFPRAQISHASSPCSPPLPPTTYQKRKKYSILRKVRASPCSLLEYVIISTGTALDRVHNAFMHALVQSLSPVRQVSLLTQMGKMRLREVKKLAQGHIARQLQSWDRSPGICVCNTSGPEQAGVCFYSLCLFLGNGEHN